MSSINSPNQNSKNYQGFFFNSPMTHQSVTEFCWTFRMSMQNINKDTAMEVVKTGTLCDIAKGEFLQLLSEKRSTQSKCKIIIIISELTTRPETSYHSTTLVTFNSHQIFNSDSFEIILSCNIQIYFKMFSVFFFYFVVDFVLGKLRKFVFKKSLQTLVNPAINKEHIDSLLHAAGAVVIAVVMNKCALV